MLLVKIAHPSMSGAFEPADTRWPKYLDYSISESRSSLNVIEEYFNGNLREGQEIHQVVITQRLYQTSSNSTQA